MDEYMILVYTVIVGIIFIIVFFCAQAYRRIYAKNVSFFRKIVGKGFHMIDPTYLEIKPKGPFWWTPTQKIPESGFSFLRGSGKYTFVCKKDNNYFFNFQFTISTGKSRATYYYFCYLLQTSRKLIPMQIRGENFFDKLIKPLYSKDIPIFANKEWSDKFHVTGKNESAVQSAITGNLMQHMRSKKYNLQTKSDELLLFVQKRGLANSDDLLEFVDDAIAIGRILDKKR